MSKVTQVQTDIDASTVPVDASGFGQNLDNTVDTVQKLADAVDILATSPATGDVYKVQYIEISPLMYSNKYVNLDFEPADPDFVTVSHVTGTVQYNVTDFEIVDDGFGSIRQLNWDGLGLQSLVVVGTRLVVSYGVGMVSPSPVLASNITAVVSSFDNILSIADNTVQKALMTLDDHTHDADTVAIDASLFAEVLSPTDDDLQTAMGTLDAHGHLASKIEIVAAGFNGLLSPTDDDLQTAMETIDNLTIPVASFTASETRSGIGAFQTSYTLLTTLGGTNPGNVQAPLILGGASRTLLVTLDTTAQITYATTSNFIKLRVTVNGVPVATSEQYFALIKDTATEQQSFPLHFSAIIPAQTGTITVAIEGQSNDPVNLKYGVLGTDKTVRLNVIAV